MRKFRTQLDDLQDEAKEIEKSMQYCEVKGRQDSDIYKQLENRYNEIQSIILNIR